MQKLEKRVAWVTEGGRGIGRAIALALATAGADVAISSRSEDELESVAEEVRRFGPGGLPVQADVRSFDEIRACADTIQRELGAIDIAHACDGGRGCAQRGDHQLRARIESENLQSRIFEPEEPGPMAVLLASEESAGITGQVISVDGGYKV